VIGADVVRRPCEIVAWLPEEPVTQRRLEEIKRAADLLAHVLGVPIEVRGPYYCSSRPLQLPKGLLLKLALEAEARP